MNLVLDAITRKPPPEGRRGRYGGEERWRKPEARRQPKCEVYKRQQVQMASDKLLSNSKGNAIYLSLGSPFKGQRKGE